MGKINVDFGNGVTRSLDSIADCRLLYGGLITGDFEALDEDLSVEEVCDMYDIAVYSMIMERNRFVEYLNREHGKNMELINLDFIFSEEEYERINEEYQEFCEWFDNEFTEMTEDDSDIDGAD